MGGLAHQGTQKDLHFNTPLFSDVFFQSLASGAGRAAQLPTCLFGIQIAIFGLWAESLPTGGLEPPSSSSEDHIQYLNLSGGVLGRVFSITFARRKGTGI